MVTTATSHVRLTNEKTKKFSFDFVAYSANWPQLTGNRSFDFRRLTQAPKQYSILIKNVLQNVYVDGIFESAERYFTVTAARRIIRCDGERTSYVPIDFFSSVEVEKDKLRGKIFVGCIPYSVDQYRPPARIIFCRKCCQSGHYMKDCSAPHFICNRCDQMHDTRRECQNSIHRPNCGGPRYGGSSGCLITIEYRKQLVSEAKSFRQDASRSPQRQQQRDCSPSPTPQQLEHDSAPLQRRTFKQALTGTRLTMGTLSNNHPITTIKSRQHSAQRYSTKQQHFRPLPASNTLSCSNAYRDLENKF
ncbi:unnamed protein product [Didymodactylos carnosus]|uniref:CCHC-type domain-containing protein n=1 Tax=Didymodactylos carnosus TaxID=1234261 RepID=A0A815B128_9BILA|nr:unnamed protein product [Didymodactylos carnosus]CAF4042315.1 unnamed protein product [Didymodactylos carnosus]